MANTSDEVMQNLRLLRSYAEAVNEFILRYFREVPWGEFDKEMLKQSSFWREEEFGVRVYYTHSNDTPIGVYLWILHKCYLPQV